MNNEEKLICKDFEQTVWLYLDKELEPAKIEFWNNHISVCKTCTNLIAEIESIRNMAKEEASEDILDSTFDRIVENALSKKRTFADKQIFYWLTLKHAFAFKVAVISGLALVALVISLTSRQPNPIKNLSNNILDWEGHSINTEINEVSKKINSLDNESWENKINLISNKITQLETKTDKFSFN